MKNITESRNRGEALKRIRGGYDQLFSQLCIKATKGLVRHSVKIECTGFSDVNCLVSESIVRWLSCQRFPDERILHYLTSRRHIESRLSSIVDSIIKNGRSSAHNRQVSDISYVEDDPKHAGKNIDESLEQKIDESKFIELVKLKEGTFVANVAYCILKKNLYSRREIASELDVSDARVRTAKGKLRNMLEKVYLISAKTNDKSTEDNRSMDNESISRKESKS